MLAIKNTKETDVKDVDTKYIIRAENPPCPCAPPEVNLSEISGPCLKIILRRIHALAMRISSDILKIKVHSVTCLFGRQTPRHYVVTDTPDRPRRAEEQYSYSYASEKSESTSSSNPHSSVPTRNYSSSSERVNRSTGSGPGSYSYSTERSSRNSDYPGSYHSSYSSSTSGRLPHGTTYRHFSYRV